MTKNKTSRNSVIQKFSNSHFGFTLIESLAVIAIIGVLASLSIYVASGVQKNSRDARRKSDLTAISLGFQARYEAKTCSDPSDVGFYPGRSLYSAISWSAVSALANAGNDCGPFSEYLITIPTDPKSHNSYIFDLSSESSGLLAKHYRLSAILEKTPNNNDLARTMTIWHDSFGGANLPPNDSYNYVIGN